jgi:hypothetical protein
MSTPRARTRKKRTGGGRYAGLENPIYFFAANDLFLEVADNLPRCFPRNALLAINEIANEGSDAWRCLLAPEYRLFIDSGIFNLTMKHARSHNVSMDTALSLAPNEIDGFQPLFDKYLEIVTSNESNLWGYVELDQGGRDNKIATRTRLETHYGLRPIPVFHPLNDGWDYLDFLLSNYDRICVGNIVKASWPLRIRLLAEIARRWKAHPDVWIHALGLSPQGTANTFRPTSCDSSSWCGPMKWQGFPTLNFESANSTFCDNLKHPTGMSRDANRDVVNSLVVNYMAYDHSRGTHLRELTDLRM